MAKAESTIIGTPVTDVIGGVEFTYGWMRYNTSIANREREFCRIDGKRVPGAVFWPALKAARDAEAA